MINYPTLMSQHQMEQGYVPSLHSMFQARPHENGPVSNNSLLFQVGRILVAFSRRCGGLYNDLLHNLLCRSESSSNNKLRGGEVSGSSSGPRTRVLSTRLRSPTATSGEQVPPGAEEPFTSPRVATEVPQRRSCRHSSGAGRRAGCCWGRIKKSKFVVTTLLIPQNSILRAIRVRSTKNW